MSESLASAEAQTEKDPRRWWALVALSLAVLLVAVDNTILALAIPSLSESLSPTPTELLWIGDIYSFVLAGLLVTMGNVGDRVGRKKLLMIGLVGFAVVSVIAAFAPTAEALIASRALLGVAGATLMPSTLSLIRNTFLDARERTKAIAVWSAVAAAGGGLGPLIGGVLLEHFWWGSVFLVNVPIVIVIIGIGAWALRESKNPNPGPIDILSVVLSMVAILGTIAGIKDIAIHGFSDPYPFAYLVIGLVSGYWFVRRQLTLESPLIDMELFKVPAFSGAVGADLVSVFGLMGVYFFLAQQFQLVQGESPLQSGFQLLPAELAALVGAFVAARVIRKLGRRAAVAGGIALGAIGLLGLGVLHLEGNLLVITAMVCVGLGFGCSLTATADAILAAAPPERAGAAGAVSETAYELGAALGIAILGSILGAWYRHVIVIPPGLPSDASAAVEESLSTTVEAVQSAPASIVEPMLEASKVAFTDALSVTCLVAGVICAIAAYIALRVLPTKENEIEPVGDH
ncbi:MAG TPA: MFS transporter [Actinobacteria bacterium]|nr:MFS transporter [Actinomycetota bacterium]